MGLDGLFLHSLVHELRELLLNARVHHISQPRHNDIILTLRQPGANHRLLLSADPIAPRLHMTDGDYPNPLTPPAFCMLLRKHLEPARLLDIQQAGLDRVVTLRFEVRDETGQRAERHLILEIMGRHSNILLVDPNTSCMLDGIRHVTAEQSRRREVLPGRPYIAPPPQQKENPFQVEEERFLFNIRHTPAPRLLAQALVDHYDGLGPDATREILCQAGLRPDIKRSELQPDQFTELWVAFTTLITQLKRGQHKPWGAGDATGKPIQFWVLPLRHHNEVVTEHYFSTANALLDWFYTERQAIVALENLRQQLVHPVRSAWEKVTKRVALQQQALQEAARAYEYRLKGELLLAHQKSVVGNLTKACVPNYYEAGAVIEIELDPALNASENAQLYFKRYQKARKTEDQAHAQLSHALVEKTYLESVLDALERANDTTDLAEIRDELQTQGLLPKPPQGRRLTSPSSRHLHFRTPDGTEILVGKNNRQNDAITMGLAKPDDLWLHVKDIPGSHVVIRSSGHEIPDDTLTFALHLAAYYSQARESSQVPVDYCLRRYVRKPKGAKPGFVIYDHQKTAYITPDPNKIERLQKL